MVRRQEEAAASGVESVAEAAAAKEGMMTVDERTMSTGSCAESSVT